MTNIQLYLEDELVDMTDVINIPLNKTFETLSDPATINNDFSKTIKIPVSVRNNEVLGNAFRLDKMIIVKAGAKNIGQYLDPTKKIKFKLLNNGDLIMEGYAKLSLVDYSANDRFYTINLFGVLGDLFHKLLNVATVAKFCPDLSEVDIWKDKDAAELQPYAQAFNKRTNKMVDNEAAKLAPDDYIWRDMRYFIADDYLSGNKTVSAQYIKECWESTPSNDVDKSKLENIKEDGRDFDIVGFMPTHHGFPNNFDPTSYEHHDNQTGFNKTMQFTDTADANSGFNTAALIGNGLTEEQFQQFISWQQKPYIYINKLFMLFQKQMENNPDLFDGYKLEIDPRWASYDADTNMYTNPYWYKLCYTLDFLFNDEVNASSSQYSLRLDDNVQYTHYAINDTAVLGVRSILGVDYEGDKLITNITLDGYACIAWPFSGHHHQGYRWAPTPETGNNKRAYYGFFNQTQTYYVTNQPQLLFSHFHKNAINNESGTKHICNGGYRVTVFVYDENGNEVNKLVNVWAPTYLKDVGDYGNYQTTMLIDPATYNGQLIDIIEESDKEKAAVLLHRNFKGSEVSNNKLVKAGNGDSYYIGIGFPLRSFGSIPVGVKNPQFEVQIEAMSEYYKKIADDYNYCIGGYSGFDLNNNWYFKPCNINSDLFAWTDVDQWINQTDENNYTTMFYQKMSADRGIVKYSNYSQDAYLNSWLKEDSDIKIVSPIGWRWRQGGATYINNYGRYYSLVRAEDANNPDILIGIGADLDNYIKIGQETDILSTTTFIENHHKLPIKLENIWRKESGIFNILLEYSKIYGLYWNIDNVNKKIQLLSRFSYFKDYTVEDWTNKVDYSKDFQITPILHESKYLNFDYVKETDANHYTDYGENYLTRYGGYKLKTGYDFTPDSADIFKDIHSTCISNRSLLTWEQIYNYSPLNLPYTVNSPFTMMDADTKDETKAKEINNWIFRNDANILFSDDDISRNIWYDQPYMIIDDTPTMLATQKYMYLDAARDGNDYYGQGLKCTVIGNTFPAFSIVSGNDGCLFAAPAEDYTIGKVADDGNKKVRDTETQIQSAFGGRWIYERCWRKWMNERYNINNKKLVCYVRLKPEEFYDITPIADKNKYVPYFANFKTINNQLYILNKIFDYNPYSNEPTKCEFIQITDIDAYKDESQVTDSTFLLYDSSDIFFKPTLSNNIYHLGDVPTSSAWKYYNDYYTYYIPSIHHNIISIKLKPADDVNLYSNDFTAAAVLSNYGYITRKELVTTEEFETNNNIAQRQIKFAPYFTWFISTNAGNEKYVSFTAEKISDNESRTITYGLKNIQPYFKSLENGTQLISVDQNGNYEHTYTVMNNLGITAKVVAYHSFYEIPLLCIKNATGGEGQGSDEIVVRKIIIPTENRCVTSTFDSSYIQTSHQYKDDFTISGKQMMDSIFNDTYNRIVNNLRQTYDTVSLVPNKDGDVKPYKLYTTIVYALETRDQYFGMLDSYKYAYSSINRNALMYGGFANGENKHTDEFSLLKESDYASRNIFMFGSGKYQGIDGLQADYLFNSADANIVNWEDNLRNIGYVHEYSAIPAEQFINNPLSITSIPLVNKLGRCRIEDYYNYYGSIPFLCDFDTNGYDGYVYQTYYQEVYEGESYFTITADGGRMPEYIMKPCDDTTIKISISYMSPHFDMPDASSITNVSVHVEPYDESLNIPNIGDGVRYENGTLYIPRNDTGYARNIIITFTIDNSLSSKTYTIYQAACSN